MTGLVASSNVALHVEEAVAFPSCLCYWGDDRKLKVAEDNEEHAFREVGAQDVDERMDYLDEEVVHEGVASNKDLVACSADAAAAHEDCKSSEEDEVHSYAELLHRPGCSPIELEVASLDDDHNEMLRIRIVEVL